MTSFDGLVSHVKQSDTTVYVGSVDRSRNTTDFNIHTDGLYYKEVPEILGLYCIDPGNQKNISYITDTKKALEMLSLEDINILEQLQYTYIGRDGKFHTRDIIENDPLTKSRITNISAKGFVSPYAHLGINMPDLFESNIVVSRLYNALQQSIIHKHIREKGDLMLLNNNKFSHGRTGNIPDNARHLLRMRFGIDRTHLL